MKSGIYIITNLINGKYYIGLATDFKKRYREHKHYLRNNNHPNQYLQNSWNKYGERNFTFELLEEYPNEGIILPSMENYWCNLLDAHNPKYGYNLQPTNPHVKGGMSKESAKKALETRRNNGKPWHSEKTKENIGKGKKGLLHSEEAKRKMSLGQMGREVTQETRDKIGKANSISQKGKVIPQEVRDKISNSNKGKKKSKESIEKRDKTIRDNPEIQKRKSEKLRIANTGKKASEETKKKQSELKKGTKQSQETINKRVEKLKGKVRTDEQKEKISKGLTGKVQSEEYRKNRVDSWRRNKELKKLNKDGL